MIHVSWSGKTVYTQPKILLRRIIHKLYIWETISLTHLFNMDCILKWFNLPFLVIDQLSIRESIVPSNLFFTLKMKISIVGKLLQLFNFIESCFPRMIFLYSAVMHCDIDSSAQYFVQWVKWRFLRFSECCCTSMFIKFRVSAK